MLAKCEVYFMTWTEYSMTWTEYDKHSEQLNSKWQNNLWNKLNMTNYIVKSREARLDEKKKQQPLHHACGMRMTALSICIKEDGVASLRDSKNDVEMLRGFLLYSVGGRSILLSLHTTWAAIFLSYNFKRKCWPKNLQIWFGGRGGVNGKKPGVAVTNESAHTTNSTNMVTQMQLSPPGMKLSITNT